MGALSPPPGSYKQDWGWDLASGYSTSGVTGTGAGSAKVAARADLVRLCLVTSPHPAPASLGVQRAFWTSDPVA